MELKETHAIRHQNSIPMMQINVYIIRLVVIEVSYVKKCRIFCFSYMYYHKVLSSSMNKWQLNSSAPCKEVLTVFK